jgi:hypothetical protein
MQPVPATYRSRLQLSFHKLTSHKVHNRLGQIDPFDLTRFPVPKIRPQKKSK